MKQNRRVPVIAITFLIIGIVGLFTVNSNAQQNNMGMMGMGNCMMRDRMPKGMSPDQLPDPDSKGAHLLGKFCSQCHRAPGPGMHTADEWPIVVARMNQRMQIMSTRRMMMHIEAPNENEYKILMEYIEKNAQQTINVDELQGAETQGGLVFQKTCSECHALPDPEQHPSNEWPAVVNRMRENMKSMGVQLPNQATIDNILKFLQTYSAK